MLPCDNTIDDTIHYLLLLIILLKMFIIKFVITLKEKNKYTLCYFVREYDCKIKI